MNDCTRCRQEHLDRGSDPTQPVFAMGRTFGSYCRVYCHSYEPEKQTARAPQIVYQFVTQPLPVTDRAKAAQRVRDVRNGDKVVRGLIE